MRVTPSRKLSTLSLATLIACAWAVGGGACGSSGGINRDAAAGSGGHAGAGGTAGVAVTTGSAGASGSGGGGGTGGALTDGGLPDASDACTGDACGCPDSDLDGYDDCVDLCPQDSQKHEPLACGCGVADTDSDNDGTPNCHDGCPNDPMKTAPMVCGCGVADADTDQDGTLDCLDACPKDPARTTAGACGCKGIPDGTPLCLVHRYSFAGTGTEITDSITIPGVSPANGTAMNVTLVGTGDIVLAGGANGPTQQYVSLPSGIISSLGNSATIEAWVNWSGAGNVWQRIFDFGNSDQPDGGAGSGAGQTYLFVTPANSINGHLRAALTVAAIGGERVVNGPTLLPFGTTAHVALVIDGVNKVMSLYLNGAFVIQAALFNTTLSGLHDVNNWLGRSQFMPDPGFQGSITELRIYSAALSTAQIMTNAAAGPDVVEAAPPPDAGVPDAADDVAAD